MFGGSKHGAARNLQVLHRRRAPHRAGHACRTSILPTMGFVHTVSATQWRWRKRGCPGSASRRGRHRPTPTCR